MILHIPHSSRFIPDQFRDQFVLNDDELYRELIRMTDAYTDELFDAPGYRRVVFAVSRLVVDVERYRNDENEPMASRGMGVLYMKTSNGKHLRRDLAAEEKSLLLREYYDRHHRLLDQAVEAELIARSSAIILDCHSFPSNPLPCDQDQLIPRPDFCLGTDALHTPMAIVKQLTKYIEDAGYRVGLNRPYSGTMVPSGRHGWDKRVISLMVEVNRRLYLDERSGEKNAQFIRTGDFITKLLDMISHTRPR